MKSFIKRGLVMKRIFSIALVIGMFLILQQTAFGEVKVGVVDMQLFQKKSKAFAVHRAKLKEKFDSLSKKMEAEKESLMKAEDEFRKQMMMLSLDAQEDKRRELEKKQRRYKFVNSEYIQEMKAAETDATRMVGMEIGKVVQKIGKTKGYTIIIEKRSLGLIFWDDSIDITEEVIEAYDKQNQ
jgi:Skp family chaperone for outer membrane proteins